MKKYLIAGGAAVAVFAMSAFAASLTVEGGILQAGSDADLTCTDGVSVDYTGFEGDAFNASGERAGGGFTTAEVAGLGSDCDDASVYLRLFDNEGDEIWRSVPIPMAAGARSRTRSPTVRPAGVTASTAQLRTRPPVAVRSS